MGGNKGSKVKAPAVVFNFGGAEVSEDEKKLHGQTEEAILSQTAALLDSISKYSGCEEPIRKALNEPGPKTETAAWEAVSKAVDKLHDFYQLSLQLDQLWPQMVLSLCQQADPVKAVGDRLSTTRQLAAIFDFVFHFDEAKMINPAIQNDFSYYRRVLGRMKDKKQKMKVDEELANKMSFFFAYPTPMMKVMIDSTGAINKAEGPKLIQGLSQVANLCLQNITHNTGDQAQTILLLCCMTGCIILVDHLRNPEGAFDKKSPILIRECINLLKSGTTQSTDFLLNSLRFTTLHLNDDTTMPAIKKLLS